MLGPNEPMIPTTRDLLNEVYPGKCARDRLPPTSILRMGHRQWPRGMLDRFSMIVAVTLQNTLDHLKQSLAALPQWRKPVYRMEKKENAADYPAPPFKTSSSWAMESRWACISLTV